MSFCSAQVVLGLTRVAAKVCHVDLPDVQRQAGLFSLKQLSICLVQLLLLSIPRDLGGKR